MKELNYLVNAKDTIAQIDKSMENGRGHNDAGLAEIASEVGLDFEQVKAYIQSF